MPKISTVIVLTLLVLMLLVGCGGGSSDTSSPSDTTDVTDATDDGDAISYAIGDTGQAACYDDDGDEISCPRPDEAIYGQDAQLDGNQASFTDNGDGTVHRQRDWPDMAADTGKHRFEP